MDRWASGIDTAWLQLERETNRMVVHGVLFCDGPVDLDALRARVQERWVDTYPGFRQRPTWPTGSVGLARWVDAPPDLKRQAALVINRAFRGWEHQFLWDQEMLEEALLACGFVEIRWCRWGESEQPVFQGIERHEVYVDEERLPHVIIAEARRAAPQPERLKSFQALLVQEFLGHMRG